MFFFFFNGPATTESYTYLHTLSLHDALPIFLSGVAGILKCHGRQCQCEQRCTAQAAQTSGANPDHVTLPSDQRSVGGLPSAWPTMPAPTSGSCLGARGRPGVTPAHAGIHPTPRPWTPATTETPLLPPPARTHPLPPPPHT